MMRTGGWRKPEVSYKMVTSYADWGTRQSALIEILRLSDGGFAIVKNRKGVILMAVSRKGSFAQCRKKPKRRRQIRGKKLPNRLP